MFDGSKTSKNLPPMDGNHLERPIKPRLKLCPSRPMLYKTTWLLENGEGLPDLRGPKPSAQPKLRLPPIARAAYNEGSIKTFTQDLANEEANEVSSYATYNLFNWQRNNEGGLWLDEGFEDADTVRRYNKHPWVAADSEEDDRLEEENLSI
ncbi:MAG: hypothetical protein Q9219_007466 [cf. Caloplaca sp. 3 TL-2023]